MVHRGVREVRHPRLAALALVLAVALAAGAVSSVLFICGDLLVYGHVNW